MNAVYQLPGDCPCGSDSCLMQGTKLAKSGHLVGCGCRPCLGLRSKRSGQRKQSSALKAAAHAEGRTMDIAPTHEEQARLLVHYEIKSGEQVLRAGPKQREDWEKQARLFAERQVPPRKWAVVTMPPGDASLAR